MLKYRDSSQTLLGVSIPTADLASPTNNYIIGYNSASSKLTLIAQSGGSSQIAGYNSASRTSDDTTTSTSATDTGLTVSYTPTSASNLLFIFVYGYGHTSATSTTRNRSATYYIRRTSGTPADIVTVANGRIASVNSSSAAHTYYSVALIGSETAGSTSSHTYILRHACNNTNATTTLVGTSCTSFMIVMEMAV
jgi:hypothetical protein